MPSPGVEVLAFALVRGFFLIEERFLGHRFRKFSPWSLVAIFRVEESSRKSFFGHGEKESVEEKAEKIAQRKREQD